MGTAEIDWRPHRCSPSIDAAEPWIIPPGGIVPIWIQKLTGRYVDPRIEAELDHDAISMETHVPRSCFTCSI